MRAFNRLLMQMHAYGDISVTDDVNAVHFYRATLCVRAVYYRVARGSDFPDQTRPEAYP